MRNRICILFIIISIACNRPIQRNNEITKVELATGSCLGPCPITAVSIDSSLNFKFYGSSHALKKGYYTGKIMPMIWDSINIKLESIEYKNLYIKYSRSVDDQTLELIVHYKHNKVKHIVAGSFDIGLANKPNNISKVFYWISDIYKSIKLESVKTPIKFETTYQNPSPKLKLDQVKFPPPIKQ